LITRLASGSALKLEACRTHFPDVVGLSREETGDSFNKTVGGYDMPLSFDEILFTAEARGTYMLKNYPDDKIILLESGLVSEHNMAWHVTYGAITTSEGIKCRFSEMVPLEEKWWLLCKLTNQTLVEVVTKAYPEVAHDKGSFLSFLTGGIASRKEQLENLVSSLKRIDERCGS
jgi:hypothetical protein